MSDSAGCICGSTGNCPVHPNYTFPYSISMKAEPTYEDGFSDGYSRAWQECWEFLLEKINEEKKEREELLRKQHEATPQKTQAEG